MVHGHPPLCILLEISSDVKRWMVHGHHRWSLATASQPIAERFEQKMVHFLPCMKTTDSQSRNNNSIDHGFERTMSTNSGPQFVGWNPRCHRGLEHIIHKRLVMLRHAYLLMMVYVGELKRVESTHTCMMVLAWLNWSNWSINWNVAHSLELINQSIDRSILQWWE
jgi:hypothetical protein